MNPIIIPLQNTKNEFSIALSLILLRDQVLGFAMILTLKRYASFYEGCTQINRAFYYLNTQISHFFFVFL